MEQKTKRTIGVFGIAAVTMAAAAAAYLYLGKEAPKRREKFAAWMRSAEEEIVSEVKKLRDSAFTRENYERIVDAVALRYQQARNLDPEDVARFMAMMRESWERAGERARDQAEDAKREAEKSLVKKAKVIVRKKSKRAAKKKSLSDQESSDQESAQESEDAETSEESS